MVYKVRTLSKITQGCKPPQKTDSGRDAKESGEDEEPITEKGRCE